MGSSIRAEASGVVYGAPTKLLRIIVDPGATDGSFTLYDNTAGSGRIIASCTKVVANASSWFLELDHDCTIGIYAVISNCKLNCVVR